MSVKKDLDRVVDVNKVGALEVLGKPSPRNTYPGFGAGSVPAPCRYFCAFTVPSVKTFADGLAPTFSASSIISLLPDDALTPTRIMGI